MFFLNLKKKKKLNFQKNFFHNILEFFLIFPDVSDA